MRYFWSDLHLGHKLVANHRGFEVPSNHDLSVVTAWLDTITDHDTIYILGDIVGRTDQTEYALHVISKMPGTKHLIAGNHDSVSSIHRNGWKHQREYLKVFESVRDFARIRINKRNVLLSHFPYAGEGDDHTEETRYTEFRLPNVGLPLLHGHTHIPDQVIHGNQFHVGVDAHPHPVSERVIEEFVNGLPE